METGLTIDTFYNRLTKCSDYSESSTYITDVEFLFKRVLSEYAKDPSCSFLSIFTRLFNTKVHTGTRRVYKEDINLYNNYCISCAAFLDTLFSSFSFSHLQDRYNYKFKIKGCISGIIQLHNISYNIIFSFKGLYETQKRLAFYEINNYIYNETTKKSNDLLVVCVIERQFFSIKYIKDNYTIKRGFISSIKKFRFKRRGEHCLSCKNTCKPLLINGLDRLNKTL